MLIRVLSTFPSIGGSSAPQRPIGLKGEVWRELSSWRFLPRLGGISGFLHAKVDLHIRKTTACEFVVCRRLLDRLWSPFDLRQISHSVPFSVKPAVRFNFALSLLG